MVGFLRAGRNAAIKSAVSLMGPKRVLFSARRANPALIGSYVTSDYAKHLHDPAFLSVSAEAQNFTLVDVLRQHELWSLVRQSGKLASGDYLEVGVWRGGTGLVIAEAVRTFGLTGTVFLADTFTGVVKAGANDPSYEGGEHADASEAGVRRLLESHGHADAQILVGIFPEDSGDKVTGALRFIHIDVDVYQGGKDIVEWCFDRLVPGGFIVFDDYGTSTTKGVTKLCEEYETDARFLFIHNVNGHCVLVRR